MRTNRILIFFFLLISCYVHADNNVIYYTSNNGGIIRPTKVDAFGATIVSNRYENGQGCITFDQAISNIGDSAFQNCQRLLTLSVPSPIDTIGNNAFQGCTRLTDLAVTFAIRHIGDNAFFNCKKLSLNLSSIAEIESIGDYAFAGCAKITGALSELNKLQRIGPFAFTDCPGIIKDQEVPRDTVSSVFRFLTWNIEGLIWGTNHEPEQVDSIIENKGIRQLIAKYHPRIYTGNEVPSIMCKGKEAPGTTVKKVCGSDEDKVCAAQSTGFLMNTVVTKDILLEKHDYPHSIIFKNHPRHFAVATQYIDGKIVAIASLHLEPTPRSLPEDVQRQINSIRCQQAQDAIRAVQDFDYVIIAGDFNCSIKNDGEDLGGVATIFREAGFDEVDYNKIWNVDHIFTKGFEALERGFGNYNRELSDHPLHWVNLRIK